MERGPLLCMQRGDGEDCKDDCKERKQSGDRGNDCVVKAWLLRMASRLVHAYSRVKVSVRHIGANEGKVENGAASSYFLLG